MMRTLSNNIVVLVMVALLSGMMTVVQATVLNSTITVDNRYDFYISTDNTVAGTLIGSDHGAPAGDNGWAIAENYSTVLTPGVTNYIHIDGWNIDSIFGILGSFSLSDTAFAFANGLQTLDTNTTDWGANSAGFSDPYTTPVSYGHNGSALPGWGTTPRAGISTNAEWIWGPSPSGHAYVTAAINPVPEPRSVVLILMLGLMVALALRPERQSRRSTSIALA